MLAPSESWALGQNWLKSPVLYNPLVIKDEQTRHHSPLDPSMSTNTFNRYLNKLPLPILKRESKIPN